MIVATREAIRSIPQAIREGAYALGATQVADGAATTSCPIRMPGILTGVIIGLSRAIGETAPIITIGALTFIAFLPPAPSGASRRSCPFDWLIVAVHRDADPDVQLDLAARGGVPRQRRRRRLVLVVMTLAMNALAIWLRYRLRKNIKW